jgi:hypothetical protein
MRAYRELAIRGAVGSRNFFHQWEAANCSASVGPTLVLGLVSWFSLFRIGTT